MISSCDATLIYVDNLLEEKSVYSTHAQQPQLRHVTLKEQNWAFRSHTLCNYMSTDIIISLMKQQFVVTHRYTILQDTGKT